MFSVIGRRAYSQERASPLRVATGGNANWSSRVRCRRSPAPANRRRGLVFGEWDGGKPKLRVKKKS